MIYLLGYSLENGGSTISFSCNSGLNKICPKMAKISDKIALIRSLWKKQKIILTFGLRPSILRRCNVQRLYLILILKVNKPFSPVHCTKAEVDHDLPRSRKLGALKRHLVANGVMRP